MAPSVALSIPYEPKAERGTRSLQNDVQQLVKQKGPFHTITEHRLLQDQALSQENGLEAEVPDAGDEDDGPVAETQQQTLEKLYRARHQMLEELGSKIGETSISPALRQAAPIGSVEIKQVAQRPPLRPETTQQYNEISTVTRAHAFQAAADKIATASKRLEEESNRQAQYWEQMAVLRANGWPLSRLPSNDRALVLHFACGESGPQFQTKGIAMLQQEDSGNLVLPGQVDVAQQKVLSVTVRRKGISTGRYVYKPQPNTMQLQVETDLTRAKESLFQEELFNETAREARLVANMGVRTRSTHVEIELSPDCFIDIGHAIDIHDDMQSEEEEDQLLAQYIATDLRMLLIAEYEHKYNIRSEQPPQPLTPAARPPAEYAILRPLLAQLRHEVTLSLLFKKLDKYVNTLTRAGLAFSYEHKKVVNEPLRDSDNLQTLRKVVSSSILIHFPTEHNMKIDTETYLGAPLFGTTFLPVTFNNSCGNIALAQTSSTEDVINFLEDVLAQEVGTALLESTSDTSTWTCKSQFPLEFEIAGSGDESKGLKIKCSEGSVAVLFREPNRPPQKAMYHFNSQNVASSDDQQLHEGLQLKDLLQQWVSG